MLVLQPIRKPRAIDQARAVAAEGGRGEDGRDPEVVQPLVDRGSVLEQGRRDAGQVQDCPQVDLRHGVLPREEQPDADV
jgi:hypothetical protein